MFELCHNERSVDTFVSIHKRSHLLQNVNNTRLTIYVSHAEQNYWQKIKKGKVIGFASKDYILAKMSKIVHTYYILCERYIF